MSQLPAYYFEHLQQGLWHCTSLEGLKRIHRSGEIRASGRPSHPGSYAHHRGAVSLFCFERATERQAWDFAFVKDDTLYRSRPTPIFIGMDRASLGEDLVENHSFDPRYETSRQFHKWVYQFLWLPRVEAWCLKPIPLNAVTGYVVTSFADDGMFRFVPACPDALNKIVRIAAEFDV